MSFLVRDVYAWLFPSAERVAASGDTLSPAESDVRLWIEAPSLDDPDGAAGRQKRTMALVGYDLIEELRDVARAYREAEHARRSPPNAAAEPACSPRARGDATVHTLPASDRARPRG